MRRRWITPIALTTPSFVLLALGFLVPLGALFVISWYRGIPGSGLMIEEFTPANYVRLLTDGYYLMILWRTLRIALYSTLLSLVLGYPIALAIARSKGKTRILLLAAVVTPLLTNVVARNTGILIFWSRHGPISHVLSLLGLPRLAFVPGETGIILGLTQVFMPFLILSVSSVLENIDASLVEAARSMGSSKFRAFWKVVFPLSLPGVAAGSLFVFLLSFSGFVTPSLLGGGMVTVVSILMRRQAMEVLNWPFAAAAAVVLLLISLTLVTLYTRALGGTERSQATGTAAKPRRQRWWAPAIRACKDSSYDKLNAVGRAWDVLLRYRERYGLGLPGIGAATKVTAWTVKALIILFLLAPLVLVVVSSFQGSSLIMFPPRGGFSLRWYGEIIARTEYVRSFFLSLQIAGLCVLIGVSTGTLAALALVRYRFPGREILRTLFLSPLMLPAVLVGLALLRFLVMMGWTATFGGVLLGHLVLVTAYVTRTMAASLVGFDRSLEEASRDLGAGPLHTFRRITFPLIKPGLVVSSIFAFIVSFNETTVSIFVTGPGMITLSVRMFAQLEFGLDPTVTAISSTLVGLGLVTLAVVHKLFGLEKFAWR